MVSIVEVLAVVLPLIVNAAFRVPVVPKRRKPFVWEASFNVRLLFAVVSAMVISSPGFGMPFVQLAATFQLALVAPPQMETAALVENVAAQRSVAAARRREVLFISLRGGAVLSDRYVWLAAGKRSVVAVVWDAK
jgi:hypothetical protein